MKISPLLILLSSLSVAFAFGAARAADLPLKAPAAVPVKFTWTGCYVGGHLGSVVSQDTNVGFTGKLTDYGSTGFVGGGQIGCDRQFASNWVIGIEGRAAWTSLDNRHAATVLFPGLGGLLVPSQDHIRNDFLASATARVGYVHAERWLFYVRGGAAWTHEEVDDAFIAPGPGIPTDPGISNDRSGWTAGGGVEWAFAPHWSANVEYNYYDFGTQGMVLTGPVNSVTFRGIKDTIHAATIGVNYHF